MQTNAITRQGTVELAQQRFVAKVYWWMCIALLTTGFVSYYVAANPSLIATIFGNSMLFIVLVIAQFGLVIALSAAINRLSAMTATALFFLYSALTGLTLSVIFIAYTQESLVTTFLVTAGTFGVTAFYGYVTKKDLTQIGSLAFMGLIGIIIASIVNWFFQSTFLNTIVTYIGVLVFVGLTAYDTQKIKQMGPMFQSGSEQEQKGAILGALRLYLDFINLFLMLLRIFGRRR
ncbi:MAG: Bax inhibitor-1/YccA family protein [Pseudomonadota bacterium]